MAHECPLCGELCYCDDEDCGIKFEYFDCFHLCVEDDCEEEED